MNQSIILKQAEELIKGNGTIYLATTVLKLHLFLYHVSCGFQKCRILEIICRCGSIF